MHLTIASSEQEAASKLVSAPKVVSRCLLSLTQALGGWSTMNTARVRRARLLLCVICAWASLALLNEISCVAAFRATAVGIPFAFALHFTPVVAGAACIGLWLLLRHRIGHWSWLLGVIVGLAVALLPDLVLRSSTEKIHLSRALSSHEKETLKTQLVHPFVQYSSAHDGICILIRRSDYSRALLDSLASLHVYTIAQPSRGANRE